eukprot:9953402-Karenia_brevis.AAC.1
MQVAQFCPQNQRQLMQPQGEDELSDSTVSVSEDEEFEEAESIAIGKIKQGDDQSKIDKVNELRKRYWLAKASVKKMTNKLKLGAAVQEGAPQPTKPRVRPKAAEFFSGCGRLT